MTKHPSPPFFIALTTYFSYGLLMFFGYIRDAVGKVFKPQKHTSRKGYAPIVEDFEDFYIRRLYNRIEDCWNRPVDSCPGSYVNVRERVRENGKQGDRLVETGKSKRCMNLGSYNYLGFGDPDSPTRPAVYQALDKYGVSSGSTRTDFGTTSVLRTLEETVARYTGKEDAMCFSMGFGTNAAGLPSLVGKGCLLISDAFNHSSIVTGARASGAKVGVFKHNDVQHLESVIRKAIINGQPRTHRPWDKILIVVEGIYSMEGETCPLPEIVAVKKKYKCFLYVDEAHSIGAIGPSGRGICEHTNTDPADIDLLMGTFTKSFGGVGGYIAADKDVVAHLKSSSSGYIHSANISPPACQQVLSALKIMMGEDGTNIGKKRLFQIRQNANMFRKGMADMGCHTLGDWGSPVVPVMLYNPTKMPAFSRECLKLGLAVVVVGFPATPLLLGRTRFCISAAHTEQDIKEALEKLQAVATKLSIRFN